MDHLNIVGVVHEGDVTEHNVEKQWKRADTAMSVLDGVVPYCMNIGNHDLGSTGEDGRDTRLFNEHFGVERFQSEPWYGDHYGKGNENAFYLVDAAGMSFLILCLEFAPRDKVLAWADGVVWEHERHRVVLVRGVAKRGLAPGQDVTRPHGRFIAAPVPVPLLRLLRAPWPAANRPRVGCHAPSRRPTRSTTGTSP